MEHQISMSLSLAVIITGTGKTSATATATWDKVFWFLWYVGHVGYTHECLKLWIMLRCLVIAVTLLTVFMSNVFCVYACSAIVQGGFVCLIRCDPVCVYVGYKFCLSLYTSSNNASLSRTSFLGHFC